MTKFDLVMFELEGERYGFDISIVREVVEVLPITPVPETPDFILGVINLRGEIIPVLDTKMRLGFGKTDINEKSKLIIIESGENKAGLLLEELPKVLHTDRERVKTELLSIQSKLDPELISGAIEEEFVIMLNPEAIILGGTI